MKKKNKKATKRGASRIGSVKKIHGSRGGKKTALGRQVYGVDGTMSDDNSIRNSSTTNMNNGISRRLM